MTTPLIMLGLLLAPYVFGKLLNRLSKKEVASSNLFACAGITLVFCLTGIGHFVKTGPMAEMLPSWVPWRIPLVYVTGVVEIAAAFLVLVPSLRRVVGWALIAMLVSFLPVNVYAAANHVEMGGHHWGPIYLLIRIPLQVVLICWIWWFAAKSWKNRNASPVP